MGYFSKGEELLQRTLKSALILSGASIGFFSTVILDGKIHQRESEANSELLHRIQGVAEQDGESHTITAVNQELKNASFEKAVSQFEQGTALKVTLASAGVSALCLAGLRQQSKKKNNKENLR